MKNVFLLGCVFTLIAGLSGDVEARHCRRVRGYYSYAPTNCCAVSSVATVTTTGPTATPVPPSAEAYAPTTPDQPASPAAPAPVSATTSAVPPVAAPAPVAPPVTSVTPAPPVQKAAGAGDRPAAFAPVTSETIQTPATFKPQ